MKGFRVIHLNNHHLGSRMQNINPVCLFLTLQDVTGIQTSPVEVKMLSLQAGM
jgi:hypothetical protein